MAQEREVDKEFLQAVQDRDIPKMNDLLARGANLNAREPTNGHFALQYAINWPDAGLVKLLIERGADVNAADHSGYTALIDTVRNDGVEYRTIAKMLIDHGADIHAKKDAAILTAIRYADPSIVKLLLEKGAPVNGPTTEYDEDTELMTAASGASVESVRLLLDAGADIKATNKNGETALIKAATMDHRYSVESRLPIIELLLKRGAEIEARDKSGKTALLHAVQQQMSEAGGVISHPEVLQLLLLHGADVNAKDSKGNTALIETVGVWRGPIEIPRLLMATGIDANAQNNDGVTALMVAASSGLIEVMQILTEKKLDLNLKDAEGKTALDHAIENGFGVAAKFLQSKGAVSGRTYKGEAEIKAATNCFALLRATKYNKEQEIKTLIAQGVDVNTHDQHGNTPLILAAEYIYSGVDIMKLFVDRGANVNAVNDEGQTALMWAAERNSADVAKFLLANKAGPGLRNKRGQTALHIAAANFHAAIVGDLLASGAEADLRDADGKTALLLVANSESFVPDDIMNLLLSKGADLNALDPEGNSPLITAAKAGSLPGVEYLLGKGARTDLKNKDGMTALMYARKIRERLRAHTL